jgi:hypothetical protein
MQDFSHIVTASEEAISQELRTSVKFLKYPDATRRFLSFSLLFFNEPPSKNPLLVKKKNNNPSACRVPLASLIPRP